MTALSKQPTDDLRITQIRAVTTPLVICEEMPITEPAAALIADTRVAIHKILHGQDKRLLVIAGPCSIHDVDAAIEYAKRLHALREKYRDTLLVVMRVYFEKPRTTVGWKGLINDPDLNNSFNINKGLRMARRLLLHLNEMGMPAGTEYLDLITPQYVADLVSWGAIGARTTESQVHRELASGLSCPVGFKNGTNGETRIAIDAVRAAAEPHHFISLRKEGTSAIFETTGNSDCHVILRGGPKPNYDKDSVMQLVQNLEEAQLLPRVMVDFSHANSRKQPKLQIQVGLDVAQQLRTQERRIFGVMLESHLVEGRQNVQPKAKLTYGQSITDPCLGWSDTAELIERLAAAAAA